MTAWPTSRPRPASSPTAGPSSRSRRPGTRPGRCCRRSPRPRRCARSLLMADAPVPAAAPPRPRPATTDRREVAAVVVALAAGGGLGVLATARTWTTIVVTRLAPLGPVRHDVSGRTLQPGVTGLAVVALAGVLAVLATRGVTRRAIGAVLALAGAGMVWWSLAGLSAVSDARGAAARRRRPDRGRPGHRLGDGRQRASGVGRCWPHSAESSSPPAVSRRPGAGGGGGPCRRDTSRRSAAAGARRRRRVAAPGPRYAGDRAPAAQRPRPRGPG